MLNLGEKSDEIDQGHLEISGVGLCGDSLICVGLSNGALLVFSVQVGEEETSVSLVETIIEHQSAISDIHGTAEVTASCDELGTVALWAGKTGAYHIPASALSSLLCSLPFSE